MRASHHCLLKKKLWIHKVLICFICKFVVIPQSIQSWLTFYALYGNKWYVVFGMSTTSCRISHRHIWSGLFMLSELPSRPTWKLHWQRLLCSRGHVPQILPPQWRKCTTFPLLWLQRLSHCTFTEVFIPRKVWSICRSYLSEDFRQKTWSFDCYFHVLHLNKTFWWRNSQSRFEQLNVWHRIITKCCIFVHSLLTLNSTDLLLSLVMAFTAPVSWNITYSINPQSTQTRPPRRSGGLKHCYK